MDEVSEIFEIENGNSKLIVSSDGGALISYVFKGFDYFGMRIDSQIIEGSQGQLLLPWPNRLQDGKYIFKGSEYQLPINEIEKNNSIHGLIRWIKFEYVNSSSTFLELSGSLVAQHGYPFELSVTIGYRLLENGLMVETRVENLSNLTAPLGVGWHPYFRVSEDLIDDCKLMIPAHAILKTDSRAIPTGSISVFDTEFDFTKNKVIGDVKFDTCYLEFEQLSVFAEISDEKSGRSLRLVADSPFKYLMVYSGDTLKDVSKRRRMLAIEPMTCPPNAFNTGVDILELVPDESLSSSWKIFVE